MISSCRNSGEQLSIRYLHMFATVSGTCTSSGLPNTWEHRNMRRKCCWIPLSGQTYARGCCCDGYTRRGNCAKLDQAAPVKSSRLTSTVLSKMYLPGKISSFGPRHDQDDVYIVKIIIVPTMQGLGLGHARLLSAVLIPELIHILPPR